MSDLKATKKGNTVSLEFDLFSKDEQYDSSSGKSTIKFTTSGFADIGNGLHVSVTVIEKKRGGKK